MNVLNTAVAAAGISVLATAALASPLSVAPTPPSGTPPFVLNTPSTQNFGPLVDVNGAVSLTNDLFKDDNGVLQVVPGDPGTPVSSFSAGGPVGGLSVQGIGTATVTYIGKEAAFTNLTSSLGELSTDTSAFGDSFSFAYDFGTATGFLPLTFSNTFFTGANQGVTATNGGFIANDLRISFTEVFNAGRSVIAFFEDTGGNQLDIDDMVVRVDVAPIPLPAGVWMFLTALGGMGLLSRSKRVAAA